MQTDFLRKTFVYWYISMFELIFIWHFVHWCRNLTCVGPDEDVERVSIINTSPRDWIGNIGASECGSRVQRCESLEATIARRLSRATLRVAGGNKLVHAGSRVQRCESLEATIARRLSRAAVRVAEGNNYTPPLACSDASPWRQQLQAFFTPLQLLHFDLNSYYFVLRYVMLRCVKQCDDASL